MIYGIIPVGGVASRLSIPFPKELMPLKGHTQYYPVSKLTVDNMISAGCDAIYFIHGKEYKQQIVDYYNGDKFFHIQNFDASFSEVINCFFKHVKISEDDKILFGLPDSFYKGNPFTKLINIEGLCCGLFKTFDVVKVDRLNKDNKFDVKSEKTENNSNLFWGVIKFDYFSINKYVNLLQTSIEKEVGNIINSMQFSYVIEDFYFDLGTWDSLNKYWDTAII